MSDRDKDGAPFYFAMRRPPTAAAIDEDIYLTVTAGIPTDPCGVEFDRHYPFDQLRGPCHR